MQQTTIDFLRHGEVSGGPYYRGRTNDLLTHKGWQQMQDAITGQNWDQIITSPLHRCLDFAQHINSEYNIPYIIEPSWQEIYFGDWEGKTAHQINSNELALFYQNPIKYPPKNGEDFLIFLSRIKLAWKNLFNTYPGKNILVVTHAGVIRGLFHLLLDLPVEKIFNLQVDYAGITRFQCIDDNGEQFIKLIFHNRTNRSLTIDF